MPRPSAYPISHALALSFTSPPYLVSIIPYANAGKNWKAVAEMVGLNRSNIQCKHRWQKALDPNLVKGPWSMEEDRKIVSLVGQFGPKRWSFIAKHLQGRTGKQCRERWVNQLDPTIKKEP